MGSSAEKAWVAIVKDVQDMVQQCRTAAEMSAVADALALDVKIAAMRDRLAKLAQQPSYPRATWKKLVTSLKVGCSGCTCLTVGSGAACLH